MLQETREREVPGRPEVVILDCVGSSTVSSDPMIWRPIEAAVHRILEKGKVIIIINLTKLEVIDSGGIDELSASSLAIRRCGGTPKLLGPNSFVVGFLAITGVLDRFQFFYDEQAAIDSCA